MLDSFNARSTLQVGERTYEIYRLDAIEQAGYSISHLPYSLRIVLENMLRNEDGGAFTADDVVSLTKWEPKAVPSQEIAFMPARVLLQDFTGVPAMVDLAAMRDAMAYFRGDPKRINPLVPVELVIDHSVQVDAFGSSDALRINTEFEFERNRERYAFLKWAQKALDNFTVVPPEMGIVHQVNLEYLARVVFTAEPKGDTGGTTLAYPDTLVGTDSHTTMVNGLGVLGWGVGGIEAEAAMLGQPLSMLIPNVIGFRLEGKLSEGTTATDLVLTVTEMLRKKGVVGKFVEFFGPGLAALPLADRATIANMAPEYGATCGIFPVDAETLRYLTVTGRPAEQIALVEAYAKAQGMFHDENTPEASYSDTLALDLSTVEPSVSGPKRPQDRVALSDVKRSFRNAAQLIIQPGGPTNPPAQLGRWEGEGGSPTSVGVEDYEDDTSSVDMTLADAKSKLTHGSVVIAAITSCTNTSNPSVMVGAGLLAKKAVEKGLSSKPWVKTSLAPGSRVVTEYLNRAGLTEYLDELHFNTVGYGCTTCIGNSGPLPVEISQAIEEGQLVSVAVLSGNRNFEARINSEVRANYLMSPPLVVAYALAGRIDIDLYKQPLGRGKDGEAVYLRDIWPSRAEVAEVLETAISADMYNRTYANAFAGNASWQELEVAVSERFQWDLDSTYVKQPPYFIDMPRKAATTAKDIKGARVLASLGDSITTDHISPAGSIRATSPAGKYLIENGVELKDFNSYGSRRGNHEVMARGTFANVRLRNRLAPGTEGGVTIHFPSGEQMPLYEASLRYQEEGTPLILLAGREYGSGSSRDWAAKGPLLLGVRAVIAQSYERIHRSNLIGMGILPLEFIEEENPETLGLNGQEVFDIIGIKDAIASNFVNGRHIRVRANRTDMAPIEFDVTVRIDTDQEVLYYLHGGILQYVLRQLLSGVDEPAVVSGGMSTIADPETGSQPT